MKATYLLLAIPLLLQTGCLTKQDMAYVDKTIEEYYQLHWQPLMKEIDKPTDERRFERRPQKTVVCRKSMVRTLPEECEEYRGKKKKRKKRRGNRFSYNR
ncbi:hypothetical protein [Pseudobacteriovorax antillogorgiicola]|uniref:Uncharacterized protein n=1 Tax=Pseudobacteriovorax antillogorgiicola TaxID=1513793 RepID=A0A1Y6CDT7_9BACT|nr:hypothetical protein [Pseudobacteriovorax antillogorgiicola]TCS51711.1 hypothetical protein EDD56_11096 [Pseudobacteriovorax antillogorgiicola]SMF49315.1 hypothetical protein SAMN06296036_11565 [Pseudobacteriovorax antillogorgiicola]